MVTRAVAPFSPTPDVVLAAETVFAAMAFVQTVRPIVQNYQRMILKEIGWGHLPFKHTYSLPDETFMEYDRRCKQERVRAGLKVDDPGKCPLLVAEHLLVQAEHALVDAMDPITGLSFYSLLGTFNGLENLKEYVDLTLRLLAPYCKGRLS